MMDLPNHAGDTPLHVVAKCGDVAMGHPPEEGFCGCHQPGPRDPTTAMNGHADMALLLLEHHADVHEEDEPPPHCI